MNLKVLAKASYKRAAWKNGLGFTSEIAIHPEGASLKQGNFVWRLSSAQIEKASAFSEFPFHDRTLVVLEGGGVRLFHTYEPGEDPEVVELPPLQPYEFPGDVPSRCELSSGPVTDLSVFTRKGEAEIVTDVMKVSAGDAAAWQPAGRWNFLFAADGSFEIEVPGQAPLRLENRDTLQLTLDSPLLDGQAVKVTSLGSSGNIVTVAIQGG
jgi:hypothetical protein